MTNELTKFEELSSIVTKNKPLIKESLDKAIAACKLIVSIDIDDDDQDKRANDLLVKLGKTFTKVEGLRKEYTSLIDEWKSNEMLGEKELQKEMDRIRQLRNERANKIAAQQKEQQAEIEKKKLHDQEVARIKKEMMLAVQVGISNRIINGESALAKLYSEMTLDNFEEASKKFSFTPKLQEEVFKSYITEIAFNKSLVDQIEFNAICEAAINHFDYSKCNAEYCATVEGILKTWRDKLPLRKKELQEIASGNEKAKQAAESRRLSEEAERQRVAKELQESIKKQADEQQQNANLQAEFNAQLQVQTIEQQNNTRGTIHYRLSDEKPIKIVEAMGRIMLNVIADPNFKGIYKRDKSGIPKRNEKGEPEYIDAIQSWLNLLAKVKPAPEFEGVVKTEDLTTIAKA